MQTIDIGIQQTDRKAIAEGLSRLLADTNVRICRTSMGLPIKRQWRARQTLHCRDAVRLQLVDLKL